MKEGTEQIFFEGIKKDKGKLVFFTELQFLTIFLFLEKKYGLYFNLLTPLQMGVFKLVLWF